jgi:hypothetical protein
MELVAASKTAATKKKEKRVACWISRIYDIPHIPYSLIHTYRAKEKATCPFSKV